MRRPRSTRRAVGWIAAAWLMTVWPANSSAQFLDTDFAGYGKHLAVRGSSPLAEEQFWINLSRLRLRTFVDHGTWFRSEAALDTEVMLGDYVSSPAHALARSLERPTYVNLEWGLWTGASHDVRQRLHRVHATGDFNVVRVQVGRQRIAWGTGYFWNPTDLLNPLNPAAIERDEEPGVDAVHAFLPVGVLSHVETAIAPGWTDVPISMALRVQTNREGYDVAVMGGSFRGDAVVGVDFVGYVGGAGLRGEATYTWRDDAPDFPRAVLGADYSLAGGTHLLVEFYLNGQGGASTDDYDPTQLIDGDSFNLGRYYVAALASHPISPLMQGSLYALFNVGDRSSLVGPVVRYSLTQDVDVLAGAYLMFGSGQSEFGGRDDAYFASVQFYF